ncbi:MAG TPA: PorP/SprF family type IX secretion system membrane protein [Puia sp.]|nr:PorP/SprF family type IX secretion system membrane protein [Puia sp.]
MRPSTIRIALLLLLAGASGHLKAQVDPHFSQYYVYPSWLNPALTGAFDGQYRVSGIYRSQWGNISSPFSTQGLSGEFTTDKNANFGVNIMNEKAGNGGYNYLTAYADYAYTGVRFGANGYQRISMGLQLGLIRRSFDPSKMTFGDQWNPVTGYNSGNSTADVFTVHSATSFDAGAGILYYDADPGKKANIFGGISFSHINTPTDKFSASGDAKLPVRYTIHGGVRFLIAEGIYLTPNLLYLHQGSAEEKMAGAYVQMKASEETDVMLGLNYRFDDAVAPYIGYTWKNMVLGASYDVNTSQLGKMVHGSNAFEISLSFTGKKTSKTPQVEFVCPRL